ncbi:MAG: hypothetical protein IJ143_03795 [Neisseriaceae bacterium]|nr:hypothetical protein [Neisseriaceae bacterium]
MNTQLTDNEALELKALIAPSDKKLAEIEDLEEVKQYLLGLTELRLSSNKYAEEILPTSIGKLSNLQKLSIYGGYVRKLPKEIGDLKQLIELNLGGVNQSLPETIKQMKELENSIPDYYKDYFEQFITFPESIGELEKLQKLTIFFCDIKSLPENIGKLKQLKKLHLEHCKMLDELPESIGDLSKLTKLTLFCCENITMLPESIGNLDNLEKLDLTGCVDIKKLPNTMVNLKKLAELDLHRGSGSSVNGNMSIDNEFDINSILQDVCLLTQLKKLNLSWHTNLTKFPENIGNLEQLTHLYLHDCVSLEELPESICQLEQLQVLTLLNCHQIKRLPENIGALNSLEELWCDYKNIDSLPLSFLQLKSLKEDYLQISLQKINETQKEKQRKLLDILLCVLKIREELIIKDNFFGNSNKYEKTVAHYATPYVAMKLLKQEKDKKDEKNEKDKKDETDKKDGNKQNPLWLGSVAYVNDPAEGNVIFEYFNGLDILKNNHITLKPVSTLATFVGCFTFNPDSLNQFRLYGKEDGKEATGVSIVIDNQFFAANHSSVSNQQKEKNISPEDSFRKKLPLYRCIYLDPKSKVTVSHLIYDDVLEHIDGLSNKQYSGREYKTYIEVACRNKSTFYKEIDWYNNPKAWENYRKEIKLIRDNVIEQFSYIEQSIISLFSDINIIDTNIITDNDIINDKEKIISFMEKNDIRMENIVILNDNEEKENKVKKQIREKIMETVSFLLLPLSYMVKHSAYQEEQECRIFRFVSFDNPDIKTDIDKKQMYVEYLPMYYHNSIFGQTYVDTYVKKIYLSPYAEKYADMFRVLINDKDGKKVRSSDNPFR